jgi:hypothetical protein
MTGSEKAEAAFAEATARRGGGIPQYGEGHPALQKLRGDDAAWGHTAYDGKSDQRQRNGAVGLDRGGMARQDAHGPDLGIRVNMSARRIVITKHAKTLVLFDGEEEVLRIPVVIGKNAADKEREGDLATPEGEFYICEKNFTSKYHRFLGLSYPNIEDAERGLREKIITRDEYEQIREAILEKRCPPWKTALGGEVGLHGPSPNVTWTHGCVAMSVEQIERLYDLMEIGDEVVVRA